MKHVSLDWRLRTTKSRWLAVGVCLIAAILFFHQRGLAPGQTFLPVDLARNNYPWRGDTPRLLQNWLISDPLYEIYPFLASAVAAVRGGEWWPLWNPLLFLGHPTLADPLAQPFYPLFVWLGLGLGVARGLAIGLVLHVCIAGLFMMAYAYQIVRQRLAALLAGLTYALGGYLVTWFEHTNWVTTLAYLPGVLLLVELALARRRMAYAVGAALLLALAILGGQHQFIVSFATFLILYGAGRSWEARRNGAAAWGWPWVVVAIALGLGALVAGVTLAPFAEFLEQTHRARAQGLTDALLVRQLTTLILPDFYGNPSYTDYWGVRNYSEATLYAGVVTLYLALVTFVGRTTFRVRYLGLLTLGLIYVIVGGPGVTALGSLPIVKYVSLSRSSFLLPLLMGLLAASALANPRLAPRAILIALLVLGLGTGLALGLQVELVQSYWEAMGASVVRAGVLVIVAAGLLLARSRFATRRTLFDAAIVGLVFVDLWLWGARYNPAGPIVRLTPPTDGIEYLQAHSGGYRVVGLQRDNKTLFGPNILTVFGLAEPGGYTSAYANHMYMLVRAGDPTVDVDWMAPSRNILAFSNPSTRLLDLLHVNHKVMLDPLGDPGIRAEFVQQSCVQTSVEIRAPVAGSFDVRDIAINRLDFLFRREGDAAPGALRFRLWQGTSDGQLVVENEFVPEGIDEQGGYTLYFSPLRDAPGHRYVWELAAVDPSQPTGVSLCQDENGSASLSLYGTDWAEVYADEIVIAERLAPLPRAYVVYAAEVIATPEAAIARLLDESFDLRNVAVIEQDVGPAVLPTLPASRAAIVSARPTQVVIEGEARQAGLLIVGDAYHPGWQATLDGQTVPILRVNHVQRGVLVPAGPYRVVMDFAPASLRLGMLASALGLVVLLGLLLLDDRTTRTQRAT